MAAPALSGTCLSTLYVCGRRHSSLCPHHPGSLPQPQTWAAQVLTLDRARYGNSSMVRGVSGPSLLFSCPFRIRVAVTVDTPIPGEAEPHQPLPWCRGVRTRDKGCWAHVCLSPSPRKRMRFLAAVWMGCSLLAPARASLAFWYQKAGSSSSSVDREGTWSAGHWGLWVSCVVEMRGVPYLG